MLDINTGSRFLAAGAQLKRPSIDERHPSRMTLDVFLDILHTPNFVDDQLQIKEAVEGTAGWIYDSPRYKDWLNSSKQIASLHIVGKMGNGKSVLMKSIMKGLQVTSRQYSSHDNTTGVIYYFCTCVNRAETGLLILKGLIAQLVSNYPVLFKKSVGSMEVLQHISPQNSLSWSFEALGTIFVTLLEHISLTSLYCIVDALDECDPDSLESFIQLTQQLQKKIPKISVKIRFFFTSREYPRILASLDDMEMCPRISSARRWLHPIFAWQCRKTSRN